MKKLTELIEKYLTPISDKLSTNKYLNAISKGFSYLMPVLMAGAIFSLLSSFNIEVYQTFITNTGLKQFFSFVPVVTTDMLAVYTAYFISKAVAGNDVDDKDASIIGIITIIVFFLLIPLTEITGDNGRVSTFFATSFLGARGLFTAMILAMIVPSIYTFFIKRKITIKMPEGVPEAISKSFGAIIPAVVIVFLFSLVKLLFTMTPYGDFTTFIYTIIQTPLTKLGANPLTFVLLVFLAQLLWFFGLHGGQIVGSILNVLYLSPLLENLSAFQAGTPLPHALTMSNFTVYATLGGSGATLGLLIIMLLKGKSKRYKDLAKLCIIPGIFGVNEPTIFGMPLVLNTTMFIPFVLTPVVMVILSSLAISIGILPPCNGVSIPLGTPVLLSGFLGVGWQGVIAQIVLIFVQIIMYYPFFKVLDDKAVKEENEANE